MTTKELFVFLGHFAVHILVGTLLFIIVYLPAVGLFLFTQWLEQLQVHSYLIWMCHVVEFLLALTDTLLFLIWIVITFVSAARQLVAHKGSHHEPPASK